jgi:alcohol dehydrogenase
MQQLFFNEPGVVEWREVAPPELLDGEDALVRPLAVATCDIDTGLVHGRVPFQGPFPLGHEGVGEVIEVGSDVTTVAVCDRVIVPFQVSCGRCGRCRRGLTGSCESVALGAMYGLEPFGGAWGGFLSDVIRVPWANHMLVPLPHGIDPIAVASLSDNICDGWRTVVPYVEDSAKSSLLVLGGWAPSIPFYSVAIARAVGVERIDYLEFPGGDAEKAARAGATILPGPGDIQTQSYTVAVCSAADVEALKLALRAVEPDGACVVNSVFFDDEVPIPMFSMYTRGVRIITGRVNARAVMPHALDLIVGGRFRPDHVTDAVVGWHEAAEALRDTPQKLVIRSDGLDDARPPRVNDVTLSTGRPE